MDNKDYTRVKVTIMTVQGELGQLKKILKCKYRGDFEKWSRKYENALIYLEVLSKKQEEERIKSMRPVVKYKCLELKSKTEIQDKVTLEP